MLKTPLAAALFAALTLSACSNAQSQVKVTDSSSEATKVGYSFGYTLGETNRELVSDIDVDAFVSGFKEAFGESEPQLSAEAMQEVLINYQKKKETQYIEEIKQTAADNLKEGQDYLAANKAKEGVQTTDSGLQYQVLTQGSGASPKATDTVKVDYEGTLINGTVFDSSIERGEPATFGVSDVIAGWTEGLQLMKEGSKYRFFIPAELAYGETGQHSIEPNSVLIFDVELLQVNP